MDVSVIFVNYKTKDLTINAINSVKEKTEDIEYEIFVVDNASNDGSIEAIEQQFPNINIIKSDKNGGFGYANNLAIKQAKGKYILCLNTDTLLINNAIKIMFDYMELEKNQNIGACGCYLIDGDKLPTNCGGFLPNITQLIWKFGFNKTFKKYYEKKYQGKITIDERYLIKKLGYVTGADLFIRKSVLDKIGIFDENLFMYFEDSDLCKRIIDNGYKLELVSDAKIQHLEGKSTKNQLQKKKWFKESELYYFQKHHPNQVWIVKLIYSILYLIDWLILGNKDSKELISFVLNL